MGEDPSRINELLDFIFSYGPVWVYLAIFAACFIENVFPPFPGDSFIIAAGALVGVGRLELVLTFLIIMAGGLGSVMLIYHFGKRHGRDFFVRKNYRYFSVDDIAKVEAKFHKWGAMILVVSRFVVGFRSALALVAGIGKYDPAKMLIFSAVSYCLFVGLLMYAAITLVENLDLVEEYINTYNMIVWPALIVGLVLFIIRKVKSVKERAR